jgi:hypothetical protein
MKLEDYLEELTDNNWHTLRGLIELERGLIDDPEEIEIVMSAYRAALDNIVRGN